MNKKYLILFILSVITKSSVAQVVGDSSDSIHYFYNYDVRWLGSEDTYYWTDSCFYHYSKLFDGEWEIYFDKGIRLAQKGQIKNGKFQGIWKSFYPSGELDCIDTFDCNGNLQSIIGFYKNGLMRVLICFDDRKPNHELLVKRWDEFGKETKSNFYQNE